MKNSFHRNRRNTRGLAVASVAVLLILAVDLLSSGALRGVVQSGSVAIWRGFNITVDAVFGSGFFRTRNSLAAENKKLRQEIEHMREQTTLYAALREDYAAVSALVHLAESTSGLTAPVASSFVSSPYGTFHIKAGNSSGVAEGDLVFSADGFMIGIVIEAHSGVSVVRELFAPGAKSDVTIHGAGAIATGRGGGNARVEIARGIQVAEGDIVRLASSGKPVGVVGKVEADSASSVQDVFIRFPLNLSSVRFVFVTRP